MSARRVYGHGTLYGYRCLDCLLDTGRLYSTQFAAETMCVMHAASCPGYRAGFEPLLAQLEDPPELHDPTSVPLWDDGPLYEGDSTWKP